MSIILNIVSAFMLVSFSWSLGYFCLYERTNELNKWNGVIWYLLFLLILTILDMSSYTLYIGLFIVLITTLVTPLEKFPNGFHYVQNISNNQNKKYPTV